MRKLKVRLRWEVEEFLGRAYYQRKGRRVEGWWNGYELKRLKTPEGVLPILVPQVRNTTEAFESRLLRATGSSTKDLQDMITRMYVRGLSTRDIEELFREVYGEGILVGQE